MSELLTVKQVARRLNVSRSHIYNLMHKGKLSYVKIGNAYRVPTETLEAWIRECTFDHGLLDVHSENSHSQPIVS